MLHFVTFFAPYAIFIASPDTYYEMPLGAKVAMCLLPNAALYVGFQGIFSFEKVALGLPLGDVGQEFATDDMTMGYVWAMLCVDAVLYALVTWYMDHVKPGPYGQARPVYFFLMVSIARIS